MRTRLGISVVLFTAAASLPAQSPVTGHVLLLERPAGQNCPVSLSARHADNGGLLDAQQSPASRKQGYQLTLSPSQRLRVEKIRVTLHGSNSLQLRPADQGKAADETETITLSPWIGQDHKFHSVVYTDRLSGVQWIELNEIKYADGTTWHDSAAATCRVAPDVFRLVASGK